ncbi:MAG: PIN domain protein [Verrucomicrobia bacterium]|nr:MAG: PIN domain protein [Verrucomicrobiota bacterium]
MTYLDTSCLVKLYYPEPDSARVAGLVAGKTICYTQLHELEFQNALQLKVFLKGATPSQIAAANGLIQTDLLSGVLVAPAENWEEILAEAVKLSQNHTSRLGCRSIDILHCAAAAVVGAAEFMTGDTRQRQLAQAIGLNLISF